MKTINGVEVNRDKRVLKNSGEHNKAKQIKTKQETQKNML